MLFANHKQFNIQTKIIYRRECARGPVRNLVPKIGSWDPEPTTQIKRGTKVNKIGRHASWCGVELQHHKHKHHKGGQLIEHDRRMASHVEDWSS